MANSNSTAPDTETTTDDLTDFFNAIVQVTGYAHATINTSMVCPETPQPDWFTALSGYLATAQTHAQDWLDTLGPEVTSKVPQTIINYGTKFNNAVNDITSILDNAPASGLSPQDYKTIDALINALVDALSKDKATMLAVQSQLVAFMGTKIPPAGIMGDAANMTTGADSAEKAITTEQSQVVSLQNKIYALQQKMQQDSAAAAKSEIGLGVAIFLCMCAVCVCVATGGAAAPLVVAGLCVVGIGTAIGFSVVYSKDVNEDLQEIYNDQQELTQDQALVTAMQSIVTSVQQLVTSAQAAKDAMSNILTTWDTLESKMTAVLSDLKSAEAQDQAVGSILLEVQDAQTAWGQLVAFAQGMENSSVTVQPVMVSPAANSASA